MSRRRIAEQVEPIEFLMRREKPETPSVIAVQKQTPHERERSSRKMTVTLPSPEWRDAIETEAERWGVRPCDVIVLAFSRLMASFEEGRSRPQNEAKFYHRAGEMFSLPWEP